MLFIVQTSDSDSDTAFVTKGSLTPKDDKYSGWSKTKATLEKPWPFQIVVVVCPSFYLQTIPI